MKKLFFIFCYSILFVVKSQDIDSLWKVFNNKNQADTIRLNALNEIAWSYRMNDPDSAIVMAKQLIQFAKKRTNKKFEAKAYHTIGYIYSNQKKSKEAIENFQYAINLNKVIGNKVGLQNNYRCLADHYYYISDYGKSIEYYNKALIISRELKDKISESYFYWNIGDVYSVYPNYPKALDAYLNGLKIAESVNDSSEIQQCYRGLASVFSYQLNYDKALGYYFKALNISEKINSVDGITDCYLHIASIYYYQKKYAIAEEYYLKKLKIDEKLKDESSIANCFIGLANVYSDQLKYDIALQYYLKALKIKEKFDAREGMLICYINTGDMYLVLKDYKTALAYQKKGLELAQKRNNLYYLSYAHEGLAKANAKLGNFKEAYTNYVQFKQLTDSVFNNENSKLLSDLKTNFEVEKKENELNLKAEAEQDKLKALAKGEKKVQFLIIFSVTGVLLLVVVFSFFLYKRFKLTNKQKHIIEIKSKETETQKHLVEEKQKEIIDSITYAKRLQNAILPPTSFITEHLPNHFIYYQPKDIVAGDFYWAERVNGLFFIAVADSTGHGVPGAMVSIVCSNALDKAVREFGLTDTGKILDKTTDLVLETFARSGEEIKDGMDISLLCIDKQNKKVFWSGAYNQLWYICPNSSLAEIKADKQPIGKSDNRNLFTTHEIEYVEGTLFYLMTDGYADQFGGQKEKKFKYRQLEELIFKNSTLPLQQQTSILHDVFTSWKDNLEQVDDVTIIGIKI